MRAVQLVVVADQLDAGRLGSVRVHAEGLEPEEVLDREPVRSA